MFTSTRSRWFGMAISALTMSALTMSAVAADETAFTPSANLEEGWYARIETTKGRIVARLLPEQAPQSVAHFAALVNGELGWSDLVTGETKKGPYYDGSPIHFAMAGELFETGDRQSEGEGQAVYYIAEEGLGPVYFQQSGLLGMSRMSGGRISGVRFFVTVAASKRLIKRRQPCFGKIVEGLEVAWQLSSVKTDSAGRPLEPAGLQEVRVFSVGNPKPLPEPIMGESPQPRSIGKVPRDQRRR